MDKKIVIIGIVVVLIAVIAVVVYLMTRPKGGSTAVAPSAAATQSATPTATPTPTVVATPTPTVAPAPEVPYNRVQYVRIQRVSPHPEGPGTNAEDPKFSIQVSEIDFFDTNGNKIVGKIQNVSYNDAGIGFNPFAAVNTVIGQNDFAHTSNTANAYIQIAFTEPLNLGKIVINNRAGFQYRMIGTEIQTFPAPGPTPYTRVPITTAKDIYTINYTPNNLPALSSEPFSFITSLPQYLRHLQNKNYLL